MNWLLIFWLSFFGFMMAFMTVFMIPMTLEPILWLIIFAGCAYLIAEHSPERYFLHGVLVGLVNSIWITTIHILFFNQYARTHRELVNMMSSMPISDRPKLMMAVTGPAFGVLSGVILGLFSVAARKLLNKRTKKL